MKQRIYHLQFLKNELFHFFTLPFFFDITHFHHLIHIIADRGITQQGEDVVFYAADKNGKIMMVNGHVSLPEGFDKAEVIILKGHLSGNSFHTHEVLLD